MASAKLPSTAKQIATCGLLILLAAGITAFLQPRPAFHSWSVGLPVGQQLIVISCFAFFTALFVEIAFRVPRLRRLMAVPSAMQGIELTAAEALYISLAAGAGEEMLFRASLQPLLGLWLAAAIFAAAHVQTAKFARSPFKKVVYLVNVFVVGVGLGLVYRYAGLLTAVMIHAIIDLAALLSLRRLRLQVRVVRVN